MKLKTTIIALGLLTFGKGYSQGALAIGLKKVTGYSWEQCSYGTTHSGYIWNSYPNGRPDGELDKLKDQLIAKYPDTYNATYITWMKGQVVAVYEVTIHKSSETCFTKMYIVGFGKTKSEAMNDAERQISDRKKIDNDVASYRFVTMGQ